MICYCHQTGLVLLYQRRRHHVPDLLGRCFDRDPGHVLLGHCLLGHDNKLSHSLTIQPCQCLVWVTKRISRIFKTVTPMEVWLSLVSMESTNASKLSDKTFELALVVKLCCSCNDFLRTVNSTTVFSRGSKSHDPRGCSSRSVRLHWTTESSALSILLWQTMKQSRRSLKKIP